MAQYVIKRILLMIPTFFAISLLIFVVLNFAPGKPGADMSAGDQGESAEQGDSQRESYRIFKEQFNLDKPVLWNTRYNLQTTEIEETLLDVLDLSGEVSAARQIEAKDQIEDWGSYAVPGLIELLSSHPDLEVRAYASQRLAINGKRSLKNLYGGRSTLEERAQNKAISAENQQIKGWTYPWCAEWGKNAEGIRQCKKTTAAEVESQQQKTWEGWFASHSERWDYTPSRKAEIFATDTRFWKYWTNLLQLDFGVSHVDKQPVLEKVFKKLRYSITLSFAAVILIYLFAVPLGIWSSVNQDTQLDRFVTAVIFMLYSLPSFFVGVFLLNLLTRGTPLQVFPTSGFESLDTSQMTTLEYLKDVLWHLVLPLLCLTYGGLAALSRYARSGLLDVIRSDYVRTARAKGLPEFIVIIKHAARNGMIPILTLLATLLPTLVSGAVVIEMIFGIPGMGLYVLDSIRVRDYNAIMAVLLISSSLTLLGMLLSDLSYALVDPRITFD